jgi:thiamine-monophosphate kinase
MKLSEIGEFRLIDNISKRPKRDDVAHGIGDDAAVLAGGLLLSTDCVIEGVHFKREWMSPEEIGMKAVEVNVSDIAAMGGMPKHILVSAMAPGDTQVAYIERIYRGMRKSCDRHGIDIIGGNFAESTALSITITITGHADKPVLRSTAKPGDCIMLSRKLGAGHAGLRALQSAISGRAIRSYRNPRAELAFSKKVKDIATSMIDISDSLMSDLRHICRQSGCMADIRSALIPIAEDAIPVAMHLGEKPLDYALFGGDDYGLIYTAAGVSGPYGYVIGRMEKGHGIRLDGKQAIANGFEHFIQ